MKTTATVAILLLSALALPSPAGACPNCKNALPTLRKMLEPVDGNSAAASGAPRQRGDMARAYAVSIMTMFFVLGGVAFGVIRLIVKVGGEATRNAAATAAAVGKS